MSRWKSYIVLLIGCCLGLTGLRTQAQSSSPDAITVRAIYAKLEFASQLQEVRNRLLSSNATQTSINGAEALAGALHVVVSAIKTGPLDEIRSVALADLVTKPSGRKLLVTPSGWDFRGAEGETLHAMTAQISWTQSPYLAEDWNMPISRMIDMGVIDPSYSRYASFTVQAIYQGDKKQYQALFLFSDDPEKKSVLPLDQIIGLSALQAFSAEQSFPEPLLAQVFRGRPEVSRFIEWWRAKPGCSTDAATGMCCDPATQQCGISSRALQTKGFGAIQSSGVLPQTVCGPDACPAFNTSTDLGLHSNLDTTSHATGSHAGAVRFTGQCTYTGHSSPCTGLCNVGVTQVDLDEHGILTNPLCHVLGTAVNGVTTPAGLPCSASWGYAVKSCMFCACGVSLSVNIGVGQVGVSSADAVHTWGWGAQWTCATR